MSWICQTHIGLSVTTCAAPARSGARNMACPQAFSNRWEVVMAKLNKSKLVGLVLCLGAVAAVTAGWAWARSSGEASTDNAYIRGDVTSLAPKVAGYVTAVEVADNQAVKAGDVL